MAVSSFASAAIVAPEGSTLVATLSSAGSSANGGNTLYVDVALKQNTQYLFRYFSPSANSMSFPSIAYFKASDSTYADLIAATTKPSAAPYHDVLVYNTQSGITSLMFGSGTLPNGYVSIYETPLISKPATYNPTDVFTPATYTFPFAMYPTDDETSFEAGSYSFIRLYGPSSYYTSRSADGLNWTESGQLGSVNGNSTWNFNTSISPSGRIWSSFWGSTYSNNSRLYYSDNYGSSWNLVQVTHPSDGYHDMIPPAYSPVNGGTLFTIRNNAMGTASLKSTDNGATWTIQSGPYGSNQGAAQTVLGFPNGFFIFAKQSVSADTYRFYTSTNGSTFTAYDLNFLGASNDELAFYQGQHKLVYSDGSTGLIPGRIYTTTAYGVKISPTMVPSIYTNSLPASGWIIRTKDFWMLKPGGSNNTYYTAPYVYTSGATDPQPPTGWASRSFTPMTNARPLPSPKTATTSDVYFRNGSGASTSGGKLTVLKAGFTKL